MGSIGKEFIELTKDQYEVESDQKKGVVQPPLELNVDHSMPLIILPKFEKSSYKEASLVEAIVNRQSLRKYEDTPLSLKELGAMLWCTQGVKQVISTRATRRTVPSAGARHAFETYMLINKVEGLKNGIYRYVALKHALIEINIEEGITDKIINACLGQEFIRESAVTFIWTAVTNRMYWRYGERGYRYLHLDAGHVCQNLYLISEALGCGACAIAAYDDDEMNKILGIDGEEQFTIYVATAGKK
jgi:SagB-type dehydrogenase family enzyme